MKWHRNLLWLAAPLIAVGHLLLALVDPRRGEHVAIGYLIGTVFSYATLASAWTAFGPLQLFVRFPLTLLWSGNGPSDTWGMYDVPICDTSGAFLDIGTD